MNNKRHDTLKKIIHEQAITTQEGLVEALKEEGYYVTQATISRDVRILGIRKRNIDGLNRYWIPEPNAVPVHYINVLKEGFVSADLAMNILVIKTAPGLAMAVAAALDAFQFPELVGCIAGDDTIMCAIRDVDAAKHLKKKIGEILQN
ncbi:MAG: arginine repressor [Lachnospiraceae bacterium]|nr:arginine repressor [Lachnospiraceae bacterium]